MATPDIHEPGDPARAAVAPPRLKSLGATLALRFAITMLVALLVIALAAYFGVRLTLEHELDVALGSTARLQAGILRSNGRLPRYPADLELQAFVQEVNRFIVVRDASGNILAGNTDLALDLPLDGPPFRSALTGDRGFATALWKPGYRLRSVYVPLPANSPGGSAVLQVSASLQFLDAEGRQVLFLMLGVVLLGTLVTMIGAGWLANSSAEPVRVITAQARAIDPRLPGQRITAHADIEEFNGLVQVLNEMLERLERAIEWQRRIIADVAHDLRTPITAMRGGVEIALRADRSVEEYRAVLRSTLDDVERLAVISDGVLALARFEAGDLSPRLETVDLRDVARTATERIQAVDGERIYELHMPPEPVDAVLDPRLIGQALDQVLDNAMRHTPVNTRVRVAVGPLAGGADVSIDDSGPGLPAEAFPQLTQLFFRADVSRSRAAGAGLGLSVASAILHAHGGTLAAGRSEMGGVRIELRGLGGGSEE